MQNVPHHNNFTSVYTHFLNNVFPKIQNTFLHLNIISFFLGDLRNKVITPILERYKNTIAELYANR